MNFDDIFHSVPIDEPIYVIDHQHKIYTVTMRRNYRGEIERGECTKGDPDSFYRNALIAWAFIT